MKTLRQLCLASMFTLALTMPAFAGEMETPKMLTPSPAQTAGEISTTIAGQMDTVNSEDIAVDSATEIALNLFQSVLALF